MHMNSRDLYFSAIRGDAEKIPFSPFLMHFAARLSGLDYCNQYAKIGELHANAQIKVANFFGVDHVGVGADAYKEASAWGVEVDFSGHTPVSKIDVKLDEFESIETPDLLECNRAMEQVKAVKILKEKIGGKKLVMGWIEAPFAEVCSIFGMMSILKLGRNKDAAQMINKLLDRIVPVQKQFAQLQIEAGADMIGSGDSAVSQIGPKRYKEYSFEHTKKLFYFIKQKVPVLYHCCGDNSGIDRDGNDMLKLLSETGADILDVDYQVDLQLAKDKIGAKTCLRGNVNTMVLGSLTYDVNEVISEIRKSIDIGKPNGKYIFSAGCEWPWEPFDMAVRNLSIAKGMNETLGKY